MKFVRLVAALSAAAILTACTSAPVATVTPPPLAATYANADLAAGGPAADTGAWWHGFHDPILDRLVKEIEIARNDPTLKEKAAAAGMEMLLTGPDRLRERLDLEVPRWRQLIPEIGIKIE